MMNKWTSWVTVLVAGVAMSTAACKEDDKAAKKPLAPKVVPDKGGDKTPGQPDKTAKVDVAKNYLDCVALYNAKDADKLKACYTGEATHSLVDAGLDVKGPDAIVGAFSDHWKSSSDTKWEPQIVLVSGNNLAVVGVGQGTNDGPTKMPDGTEMPATNNKSSLIGIHIREINDAGKTVAGRLYWDIGSEMKQLSKAVGAFPAVAPWAASPEVVVAVDDDKEKANLATVTKLFEAFSAQKYDDMHALEADDIKVWDQTAPGPLEGLDARKAQIKGYATAFPDMKGEGTVSWAAGDYVVSEVTITGTNTGPMPGVKKPTGKAVTLKVAEVRKLKDGKVTHQWMVLNSMAMAAQLGLLPAKDAKKGGKK